MPSDVRDAFIEVFRKQGMDNNEAEIFMKDLERSGRFQQECWG